MSSSHLSKVSGIPRRCQIDKSAMKFLIVSVLLILLRSSMAYACVCAGSDFEKNFARSEVVFLATVIPTSKIEWDLEIQRVWKGSASKKGKLRDSMAGTNCEIEEQMRFIVDVRYVIFASKSKEANVFYTSACDGTMEANDKLLKKLGIGRPPGQGRRGSSSSR